MMTQQILMLNFFPISASLYGEMKKYKESEAMFRKALKLNPQYTEAYFNLGTYYVKVIKA